MIGGDGRRTDALGWAARVPPRHAPGGPRHDRERRTPAAGPHLFHSLPDAPILYTPIDEKPKQGPDAPSLARVRAHKQSDPTLYAGVVKERDDAITKAVRSN